MNVSDEFIVFLQHFAGQCPQLLECLKPEIIARFPHKNVAVENDVRTLKFNVVVDADVMSVLRSIEASNQLRRAMFAHNFMYVARLHSQLRVASMSKISVTAYEGAVQLVQTMKDCCSTSTFQAL